MGGGDAASDTTPRAACGGGQLKKGKENPSPVQAAFLLAPESRSKPGSGGLIPWPTLLTQCYYNHSVLRYCDVAGKHQVSVLHPGRTS